jgi:hypothetical protein
LLDPPKSLSDLIRAKVAKDLEPSPLTVHAKLALACFGGGVLSLLVCGQFGIAITPAAHYISNLIHQNMNPLVCALVCGAVYSLFPVTVMRVLLTSPLEFKAIVSRYRLPIASWYITSGVALATLGHHGNDFISLFIWIVAAIFGAHIVSWTANNLLPVWSLREMFSSGQ